MMKVVSFLIKILKYKVLSFLVSNFDILADSLQLSIHETIDILISYVRKKCFTKDQLSEVIPALTGATAKKLIEWGMIYEFAS